MNQKYNTDEDIIRNIDNLSCDLANVYQDLMNMMSSVILCRNYIRKIQIDLTVRALQNSNNDACID
jgi:hypothetical protein